MTPSNIIQLNTLLSNNNLIYLILFPIPKTGKEKSKVKSMTQMEDFG
jgi:hypothetical protein